MTDVGIGHFVIIDTEQDHTEVLVRGERFYKRTVGHLQTRLFGDVEIAWTITKNGIVVDRLWLVNAPKGGFSLPMMKRLADAYPSLVRDALWQAHKSYRHEADTRDEKTRRRALLLAAMGAMEPSRGRGETMPEYVYRLWVEIYEPGGYRHRDLAEDLSVSWQLVRRYVSDQKREAT